VASRVLPECLDQWEAEYVTEINDEFATIIEKRKVELRELCEKRPKLRYIYDNGDVVCSLFIDCHPILVKSLITSPLISRRHVDQNRGNRPIVNFHERMDKDKAKNIAIYRYPPDRHYLMYFDCFRIPQLRITDRIFGNGWVVGV
ncbi:hypothetical protein PENTCL1PPCAC_12446, partial [Pristionchus entomophagus]